MPSGSIGESSDLSLFQQFLRRSQGAFHESPHPETTIGRRFALGLFFHRSGGSGRSRQGRAQSFSGRCPGHCKRYSLCDDAGMARSDEPRLSRCERTSESTRMGDICRRHRSGVSCSARMLAPEEIHRGQRFFGLVAVGKPHRRSFFDLFFLSRRLALELGGQKSDKQQCRTNHARSRRFSAAPGLCLAKGALAGTLFPHQSRRHQAVAHGKYVFGNPREVARAHARN